MAVADPITLDLMTYVAFISAVLALLLAPGPTNTLMGLAGARGGLRNVAELLPAELLGYLSMILPLAWLGGEAVGRWPLAAVALKLVAAAWVMFIAVRLWMPPGDADRQPAVTARRVYVTTVLNPKALVFGLILLPMPTAADFMPKLGLFCGMVVLAALAWGAAGRLTQSRGEAGGRLLAIQRIASVWLAIVSVTLIAKVITR